MSDSAALVQTTGNYGLQPETVDVYVINRDALDTATSATIQPGEVVCFTNLNRARITEDGLTPTIGGQDANIFGTVTKGYTSTAPMHQLWGVALEKILPSTSQGTASSNGLVYGGRVRVRGIVQAYVHMSDNTSTGWLAGWGAIADDRQQSGSKAAYLDAASTSHANLTRKVLALTLEANSTSQSSIGGLTWVYFDGINGLGGINNGPMNV